MQVCLCQNKWFKETLYLSIPTLQKGWMTFLLPFRLLPDCTRFGKSCREHQLGFFFFKNISLTHERRALGAKFSEFPRCCCVSLLPAKQFTPFLQGQQVFYPSQRQTNEGFRKSGALPRLTAPGSRRVWQWQMLLVEVGTQQSPSLLW